MKLKTYRIKYKGKEKERGARSRNFISDLYLDVLKKDPNWHFFLDWAGGTLRFSPEFEEKVRKWAKASGWNDFALKRRQDYDPQRHEYPQIRYIGVELQPLFHELSVLSALYPNSTLMGPVFDRLTHTFVNQLGIHDFKVEAYWLLDTAYQRARLQNRSMDVPKGLHKGVFRLINWKNKIWWRNRKP